MTSIPEFERGDVPVARVAAAHRWRTLLAAGLGWTFDGYETYALILTLGSSLPALLPAEDHARIPFFAGATIALTLLGVGVGGIVGGILADAHGRRRVLLLTVCLYALFTGLTALAWSWWSFALLRFLTGIALGSEWSSGATLVAETWPDRLRSRAAAVMQSGLGVGFFVAALLWFVIGPLGPQSWRWMFVVGVLPALFALWLRRRVPASPEWTAQHVAGTARQGSTLRRLLADRDLRRVTVVASVMSLATTLGWWGVSTFIPAFFTSVATPEGWNAAQAASVSGMVYTAGGIVGYLAVGILAERLGRRPTVAIFFAGAFLLTPVVFLWARGIPTLLVLLALNGLFTMGQYSWMAIWLPELYPTSVRATGVALVFNAARFIACIGPLVAGSLVVTFGGYGTTAVTFGGIYLVGLVVVWFCPETRGRPLPRG